MGLIETIEKKRREVMKKQNTEGQGNLTGLQGIANAAAEKRRQLALQSIKPKEKSDVK